MFPPKPLVMPQWNINIGLGVSHVYALQADAQLLVASSNLEDGLPHCDHFSSLCELTSGIICATALLFPRQSGAKYSVDLLASSHNCFPRWAIHHSPSILCYSSPLKIGLH